MDQADEELRETIQMIWPYQAKKMLTLLVPPVDKLNRNNLSVGKIYAGLLILESWRNTRFGQIDSGIPVSVRFACAQFNFLAIIFIQLIVNFIDQLLLIAADQYDTG